jgi:hypothetical protein
MCQMVLFKQPIVRIENMVYCATLERGLGSAETNLLFLLYQNHRDRQARATTTSRAVVGTVRQL